MIILSRNEGDKGQNEAEELAGDSRGQSAEFTEENRPGDNYNEDDSQNQKFL